MLFARYKAFKALRYGKETERCDLVRQQTVNGGGEKQVQKRAENENEGTDYQLRFCFHGSASSCKSSSQASAVKSNSIFLMISSARSF